MPARMRVPAAAFQTLTLFRNSYVPTQHGLVQTTASVHIVTSTSDLVDLIASATASRATSATKKNDTSSRSHCLLTLTIQNKLYPMARPGKLLVVDLAGSERASDRESHSREVRLVFLSV